MAGNRDGKQSGLSGWLRTQGREWVKSILIAFILFLFIRAFFVQAFKIPTGSMEDTLLVGDFLLVNKLIYGPHIPLTDKRLPSLKEPKKGDIIVFKYPLDKDLDFVKRCVATPGDTVKMVDKILFVNGKRIDEPYVHFISKRIVPRNPHRRNDELEKPRFPLTRDNFGPFEVPEGKYFVLGDNRDNSSDSRVWGFVDRDLIIGKPLFIYFSWDKEKFFPRFGRLGTIIR
ncbi:MAG: signal peptidase I [Candidatus Glassbacteria bacterium]